MSKKLIIIIFAVCILIIALFVGAGIGFKEYKKKKAESVDNIQSFDFPIDEEDKDVPAPKKKGEPKPSEADLKAEEERRRTALLLFVKYPYFRLPMIIVPVIRNGESIAFLYMRAAMKTTGIEAFKTAKMRLPHIVDAVFTDLYNAFGNLWDVRYKPTATVVRERIFAVTDQLFGPNVIKEVYIREMIFRMTDE